MTTGSQRTILAAASTALALAHLGGHHPVRIEPSTPAPKAPDPNKRAKVKAARKQRRKAAKA